MKKLVCLLLAGVCLPLSAADIRVSSDMPLQAAIDGAAPGDTLLLGAGRFTGNFNVNKPLTLRGTYTDGQWATIIDGQGQHDALRLTADHITIEDLKIVNWGDDLTEENAGITLEPTASHAIIQRNYLHGRGGGIWLHKSNHVKVLENKVQGDNSMRASDRGNGIHLTGVTGVEVRGNEVWHTRDGLYIITSNENQLEDNYMHDLRFGVHYMYSYTNTVINNLAENVRVGYALMQSKFLKILNNRSINTNDHGILLNFINRSDIIGNYVDGSQQKINAQASGAEARALFVYNSYFSNIKDNYFANSQVGIHLTAAAENNTITGNHFVNNPIQVKYITNREQLWTGNYWSNYLGWDTDGDGIGDTTFEPNDGVDKLLWKYPEAKLLMNSPAVLTLRWVQRQFPVLKPKGVKDPRPLMQPIYPFDKFANSRFSPLTIGGNNP